MIIIMMVVIKRMEMLIIMTVVIIMISLGLTLIKFSKNLFCRSVEYWINILKNIMNVEVTCFKS